MITGKQIAEELSELIGTGGYDPNAVPFRRRLPQTMQQLLEGEFDMEDANIGYGGFFPKFDIKAGLCRRNLFKPVQARHLAIKRPAPSVVESVDYRGYYSLLSSFYQWLKNKKQTAGINVEHKLSDKRWPLLEKFKSETKKRTGWSFYDFFPQIDWDETVDLSAAWMPLYQIEMEEDAAPLIEFLCGIGAEIEPHFPEAAYDGRDKETVDLANSKFTTIIEDKKYRTLPTDWANAVMALAKYKSGLIAYTEPDETKFDIETADAVESFFVSAKDVADMMSGTMPLVKACRENSDVFWDDLIEHLLKIPVKKKHKPKSLIQVFNEEKIQTKV